MIIHLLLYSFMHCLPLRAVGAHDLENVESPIGWPAEEALTDAPGAVNPGFNGDLSDHFGSDPAKGYSP